MDRAIDSAAAKKSGVRRIHNRIDIELRDVAPSDFDLRVLILLHEPVLTMTAHQHDE